MNTDELTLGQIKQLQSLFGANDIGSTDGLCDQVGKKVLVRTYSAGVWFGVLEKKAGNEIYLASARRLWRWKTKKGISISEIAIYGLDHEGSKVCEAEKNLKWLEAIEISECTAEAIESIEDAPNA